MANSKLHLICGNCGCNEMLEFVIDPKGHDVTKGKEPMFRPSVTITCRNCSTNHDLSDWIEDKTPDSPEDILKEQKRLRRAQLRKVTFDEIGWARDFVYSHGAQIIQINKDEKILVLTPVGANQYEWRNLLGIPSGNPRNGLDNILIETIRHNNESVYIFRSEPDFKTWLGNSLNAAIENASEETEEDRRAKLLAEAQPVSRSGIGWAVKHATNRTGAVIRVLDDNRIYRAQPAETGWEWFRYPSTGGVLHDNQTDLGQMIDGALKSSKVVIFRSNEDFESWYAKWEKL